jgi:hypothetical protein
MKKRKGKGKKIKKKGGVLPNKERMKVPLNAVEFSEAIE